MRKLFFILFAALSLTAVAQNQKTVAVLDPICRDNSVNAFYQQIVRGAMESAVTVTDEFVSFDRTAFDKVLEEHQFQQAGYVDDAQIHRIGVYAGVDLILVTEVSAHEGYMTVLVKILNIETGESSKGLSELMEQSPTTVQSSCEELAKRVFGIVDSSTGLRKGTLQLPEGKYEGEIRDGKPHGNGKIFYNEDNDKDRVSYEGAWEEGLPTGEGIMVWKSGQKYVGGWLKDKRSGWGTSYFASGIKVEGTSVDGKWKGKVNIYDLDGNRCEMIAESDDFVNGKGTIYYTDGRKYVGDCLNAKPHGTGVLYYADGTSRYEGPFQNGAQHGRGTVYTPDSKMTGKWTNGVLAGFVDIINNDGSEECGQYKNGKPDGEWNMKTANGKYLKGYYSDGVLTKKYR